MTHHAPIHPRARWSANGHDHIVLPDPEKKAEASFIVRCQECGRGVVCRMVAVAGDLQPDGPLELQHLDNCSQLTAMASSKAS